MKRRTNAEIQAIEARHRAASSALARLRRCRAPAPLTADDKLTIAEALIDRARLFDSYATPEWQTRAQQVRDLAQRFAAEVYGR